MCNGFICGGFYINPDIDIDDTCVKWNDEKKGFDDLDLRLVKARDNIVCWGLPSGDVLLFGGADENYGEGDVERVRKDGNSTEIVFPLLDNHLHIE